MTKHADSAMHFVRGMLLAQIDKSLAGLTPDEASDAAIHGVRKELKRARASLRLMRDSIGERAYHRENLVMRDAAMPLIGVRDAKVLLSTFNGLRRAGFSAGDKAFNLCVSRALQRERRESRGRLDGKVMASVALQDVRRRMASLPRSQLDRTAVSIGVVHVYKAGRKAFARARQRTTDASLHEWRKQVKYLFNQIDVLSQLSGGHLAKIRKQSHQLAEYLGLDHDLAVLQKKIEQIASVECAAAGSRTVRKWENRVRQRRAALQRKAHALGKRLYAHRVKRLKAMIDACV